MNSEELEVSLRTEFESYLKNILAEMKQEVSQLQEQVSNELERHKSQLDEVFANAVSNFAKEHEFEASFKDTVVEHLRLARDEGAQITAMAIARAEEMEKESAPAFGVKEIFEAVEDISTKPSQSEILKSLVHHATHFAPRGAFFIVKNEHLVGWRVFGKEKGAAEEKVREVFLSVSSDSVLSESVKTLATVANETGGFHADAEILRKLEFGEPQKMIAIPLIARGRGVAVLYADYGNEGAAINVEALETLVRVAGLTVEVLASNKSVVTSKKSANDKKDGEEYSVNEVSIGETGGLSSEILSNYQNFANTASVAPIAEASVVEPAYESYTAPASEFKESIEPLNQPVDPYPDYSPVESAQNDYSSVDHVEESSVYTPVNHFEEAPVSHFSDVSSPFSEVSSVKEEVQTEEFHAEAPKVEFETFNQQPEVESYTPPTEYETASWSAPVEEKPVESYTSDYSKEVSYQAEEEKYPTFETASWSSTKEAAPGFSAQEFAENFAKETDPSEYAKDFSYQVEAKEAVSDYNAPAATFEPTPVVQPEPVAQTEEFVPTKEQTFEVENGQTQTPPKSRLSERNVDLPIEVGEDERRLHNDARRFARLLVSEIKLYNEQKVKEGRDSSDLYDRLREAIDRSREMYDKRVQPPVAAKFDYFHYELVNTLAEGDDNKLGSDYPGPAV